MMDMEGKSVFISSCSRRDLVRRRAARSIVRVQYLLVLVVLLAPAGVFLAVRGGI
jgi:hypothetical protein